MPKPLEIVISCTQNRWSRASINCVARPVHRRKSDACIVYCVPCTYCVIATNEYLEDDVDLDDESKRLIWDRRFVVEAADSKSKVIS